MTCKPGCPGQRIGFEEVGVIAAFLYPAPGDQPDTTMWHTHLWALVAPPDVIHREFHNVEEKLLDTPGLRRRPEVKVEWHPADMDALVARANELADVFRQEMHEYDPEAVEVPSMGRYFTVAADG